MSDRATPHPDAPPFSEGSGFTPGPWTVDDFSAPNPRGADRYIRSDARHWAVCAAFEGHGCSDPERDITQPETVANARLISAAPEMHCACAALCRAFPEEDGDNSIESLWARYGSELALAVQSARAALSRAGASS